MGEIKTPEELAEKEVNKSLAKGIAKRQMEIKKYEAKIAKLKKEIEKIKSGELIPDEDDSSSFSSNKKTVVGFLLDESGSMCGRREETINGYNEYISTLKKESGEITLTLTKFNSERVEVVFVDKNVKDVKQMIDKDYTPEAMTPLYDAIGKTIRSMEKKVKKGDKVLFAILTDGQENESNEFKQVDIQKLIKEKEKEGWTFIYMGADQDAWANASQFGIARGNTMNFAGGNIRGVMCKVASMTAGFASSGKQTKNFFNKNG